MFKIITNGIIINEGLSFKGALVIDENTIHSLYNFDKGDQVDYTIFPEGQYEIIDVEGLYVIPGIIDPHVHFRYPGATHKGDIESESAAAVLGGVTSYMDMPNNNPPAICASALQEKFKRAKEVSYANYSFYLGADNNNIEEILNVDKESVCAIKLFMGSSTGNMLVDNHDALNNIFSLSPKLIATHCEDEMIIRRNLNMAVEKYGEEIPFGMHPYIRSREACIKSTEKALELAIENNSRLHLLHITTLEELEMITEAKKINPKITAETCINYLWFDERQYDTLGALIKCNPSIKQVQDKEALRDALNSGILDMISSDHAPHLLEEKMQCYLNSPSGIPMIQHSLQVMLQLCFQGIFTLETVVDRMCHSPAKIYGVDKRGYLKKGYYADITVFSSNKECQYDITDNNIAYKCNWSPLTGYTFNSKIIHTFVNGTHVVKQGVLTGNKRSDNLKFLK